MNFHNKTDLNFNLDIDTYGKDELLTFFKLNQKYTNEDLDDNELIITTKILNSDYDTKNKYEIITFIKKAKDILQKKEDNEIDNSNSNSNSNSNLVGKIINPFYNHPVLQTQSIISNKINGYNLNSAITNYVFNTQFRDNYFNSISSNCNFTLPLTIKNVVSISLSACQIPNVIYGFSDSNQTNEIFIHEDGTNNEAIVIIPEGNYDIDDFCRVLEDNINLQVCGIPISPTKLNYRFFVTYNEYTYLVTISNIFYTFEIDILKKNDYNVNCLNKLYNDNLNKDNTNSINENGILPGELFKTMGYIIGFREITYLGKSSYTAESTFNNKYTNYIYFSLNEFCNTQQNTTFGMFSSSLINNSILALIPITSSNFTTTFDNNSNFIYKTRVYGGPIDISKINIKILNQYGTVAELHKRDFAFSLEVTTVYDNTGPYSYT
jgi:hypothetical protein